MMDAQLLHLLVPALATAANLAVQAGSLAAGRAGVLRSIVLGFAAGMAAAAGMDLLLALAFGAEGLVPDMLVDLAVTGGAGYCWFHFVGLGETARRIRLLQELDRAPDGLTLAELLARYNAREIVDKRLARLLGNRQVVLADGRYVLRRSSLWLITKLVIAFKLAILGKRSEFDG